MDLSYFQLRTIVLEVRYVPAYLLYDRAGSFWHFMRHEHPSLKMVQVNPVKVSANIDKQFQVGLELERLTVETFMPGRHLEDFLRLCTTFVDRGVSTLDINIFSRIGVRVIFRKTFDSKDDASKAMLSLGLMKVPHGKHFGIEGVPVLPAYSLRWEGSKLGVTVNIRTQERKISVEPPFGEDLIEPVNKDQIDLDYDIDYYSMVEVPVGQFRASDWVQQAMQVIRRDSNVFLGG